MRTTITSGFLTMLATVGMLATGCARDNFEIQKDSAGRTIRVNKSTGEIVIIDGERLVVPKSADEVKKEAEAEKAENAADVEKLAERRKWPTISGVLGTKIETTSIYMNGAMRYEMTFGKKPRGFGSSYGQTITAHFLKNGIKVFEDKVFEDKGEITRIVDDNGDPFTIQISGSIAMSEEDYKALDGVTIGWQGF